MSSQLLRHIITHMHACDNSSTMAIVGVVGVVSPFSMMLSATIMTEDPKTTSSITDT